jgi:Invasin, domain 3/Cadherin-like domain
MNNVLSCLRISPGLRSKLGVGDGKSMSKTSINLGLPSLMWCLLSGVTIFLAVGSPSSAYATAKTWVGGASGAATDWNTSANWSPAGVPGSTDTVTLTSGSTFYPVLLNTQTGTIKGLTINSGAQMTLNSGSSLTASGAAPVINGILNTAGTLDFGGQTLTSGSGSINVSGGALTLNDFNSTSLSVTAGTVVCHNFASALTMSGTGVCQVSGAFNPTSFTPTKGTISYTGGNAAVTATTYYNLTISGTGTAKLAGNTTINGNLEIDSGSALDLNNKVSTATTLSFANVQQASGTWGASGQQNNNTTFFNKSVLTVSTASADASHSTISPSTASAVANGTATQTITVQARDTSNNNEIAGGATVVFSATTGSLGSVADNGNGTYSVTWTAPTSVGSGTATITATLGGTAVGTAVAASSCVVTLTAGSAAKLAFGVQPTTTTAGAAISPPVTVIVQDSNGNTVTTDNSTVTISGTTFVSGSTLSVAASSGVATFNNLKPAVAGSTTLSALDGSLTGASSNPFTVNKATPSITGVTASQSITYGTANITLSGTVSATGPIYPANGETVSVTINGSTQNTTTSGGSGGFSVNFSTATIPASATAYTITYAYAGDANLNAAANNTSTTLTVNKANTSTLVTSSTNPCLPAASITLTALISATGAGSAVPTGSVQFQSNGTNTGPAVALSSGSASITIAASSLAHGSNTIAAVYSNTDGNFNGSTGSLSPKQVVNTPPSAGTHNLATRVNTNLNVSATTLAGLDFDTDSDSLSVTGVSASSTNGGTVSLNSGTITYSPPHNYAGTDAFTYGITDTFGGTNQCLAVVTVRLGTLTSVFSFISSATNGVVTLRGYGIPTHSYDVQESGDVNFSTNTVLGTVVAAGNGVLSFSDTSATNSPRYYRFATH